MGSWVVIVLKLITNKPLYLRTGYDMYSFALKNKKPKSTNFLLFSYKTFYICSDTYSVSSKTDFNFLQNLFNKKQKILLLEEIGFMSYKKLRLLIDIQTEY